MFVLITFIFYQLKYKIYLVRLRVRLTFTKQERGVFGLFCKYFCSFWFRDVSGAQTNVWTFSEFQTTNLFWDFCKPEWLILFICLFVQFLEALLSSRPTFDNHPFCGALHILHILYLQFTDVNQNLLLPFFSFIAF